MDANNYKMMSGTEGHKNYLVFARKGNVALGVKFNSPMPGGMFDKGLDKTTYFSARLRAAPAGDLFAEEDAASSVVPFSQAYNKPGDAWTNVTWEKDDAERASTIVGSFLPGVLSGKDASDDLVKQVQDGQVAAKMAAYLVSLAGPENLVMTERELAQWLDHKFQPTIKKILDMIDKSKRVAKALEESVGTFGMQAAILKKIYEETDSVPDKDDEEVA